MLYHFNKLVDIANPKDSFEKKIADEIQEVKNKYFSSYGYVTLVYPKGKPDFGDAEYRNVWGVLKKYPVSYKSADNSWRYHPHAPHYDSKGGLVFDKPAFFAMYRNTIEAKDADLLWFLLKHSHDVKKGRVYIEDLEAEAKQENEEYSEMADIQAAIFGKRSPIAKDSVLIKQIAKIFNLNDVDKKGIEQVKNELFNAICEGEDRGDKYVNFDKFDELTDGNTKRKAAHEARKCISDGVVRLKDRAWYLMEGHEYAEKLVDVNSDQMVFKEQVFIEQMIKNLNVRSRVYDALGIQDFIEACDLRELTISTLRQKAKEQKLEIPNSTNKEGFVEKLCEAYGTEYKQP